MAKGIELRLTALERQIPSPRERDLGRMSDEELTEAMLRQERDVLADPAASEASRRHAEALLALPWHLPTKQWSIAELATWCREAHWEPRHD